MALREMTIRQMSKFYFIFLNDNTAEFLTLPLYFSVLLVSMRCFKITSLPLWVAVNPTGPARGAQSVRAVAHTCDVYLGVYVGSSDMTPSVINVGEIWRRQQLRGRFIFTLFTVFFFTADNRILNVA